MNLRERFGALCSRLGVEFQCPHCNSTEIIKVVKVIGKQRYRCKNFRKRFATNAVNAAEKRLADLNKRRHPNAKLIRKAQEELNSTKQLKNNGLYTATKKNKVWTVTRLNYQMRNISNCRVFLIVSMKMDVRPWNKEMLTQKLNRN